MNTSAITAEYRLAYWAGIIQERRESGLSIKAFCEKAGFHENIYFYWQRKLREATCEQLAVIGKGTAATGMASSGFTEIRISESARASFRPGATSSGCLYIEVGGIRITADDAYPPTKLAELLKGMMPLC